MIVEKYNRIMLRFLKPPKKIIYHPRTEDEKKEDIKRAKKLKKIIDFNMRNGA